MYPVLLSFSTHFPILFINNSSIQNILSQDNLSQNKILLIFCVACFAGYFIAYIKQHFFPSSDAVPPVFRSFTFLTFSALQETSSLELELIRLQALYVQFLAFQEQFCYML